MCLEGASRAGAELLAALPDADLRAYFVWMPMLPPDNEQTTRAASERFAEPRAEHYRDPERHLGRHMAKALGVTATDSLSVSMSGGGEGIAWDVYLAYRRGTKEIERPDFWMHQMWGLTHAPQLDASQWRRQIVPLLEGQAR